MFILIEGDSNTAIQFKSFDELIIDLNVTASDEYRNQVIDWYCSEINDVLLLKNGPHYDSLRFDK